MTPSESITCQGQDKVADFKQTKQLFVSVFNPKRAALLMSVLFQLYHTSIQIRPEHDYYHDLRMISFGS